MTETSIQRLSKEKIPEFRELIRIFGEVFEEPDTYQFNKVSTAYLQERVSDPNFICLTAQVEEKVVGGLVAYVLHKFESERKEIYIYDLGVHEDFRRKKIATNLILFLKEIAKQINACVVFVQADLEDKPAILLYESLGIREEVLQFDILI